MSLIEWKPEYRVGIEAVDKEHQELIEMINELYDEFRAGATPAAAAEALGQIYTEISAHFALEERFMWQADYPDFESHKADHEQLLDELLEIMERVELGDNVDASRLGKELDSWFSEHFSTHDARLHRHFG